jgi:hypothetical protein
MARISITFCYTFILILTSIAPASAGWADSLKQVGSDYADQKAKEAGLSYTPSAALSAAKEVLNLGTASAVSELSTDGAFSQTSATSLSLPESLANVTGSTNLLSSMNKAAENAIPETGTIFQKTISNLNVTDTPSSLLTGEDTAITQYFETSSRDTLKQLVKPVVEKSASTASVSSYMAPLTAALQATGSTSSFDVNDYLTDKVLDSMFLYMGEKEQSLRSSGGEGASALLQKLF